MTDDRTDADGTVEPDASSDTDAAVEPDASSDTDAAVEPDASSDAAIGPSAPESAGATATAGSKDPVETIPDGPRKLHWLSVPYRMLQQSLGIVFGVFIIGGGGISNLLSSGRTLVAVGTALAIVGGILALVGYFVAYYRRFEYELTPDTFDIRSGVLSRREREIPLRRIQNVDISQNVVQRALGVAEVGLETAGGGGTEAQLRYVSEDEAAGLQSEISRLSRAAKTGASGAGESVTTDEERFDTVFSITERELGVLALVSMDLRLASVLFLGVSVFAPSLAPSADSGFVFGAEDLARAVFGPLAGLGTILALALVSGALNAARYYGFTLDRGEDELRYERGLLQRFSGTIPLEKVQTLTIKENVIARAWGYASLYIETAGSAAGSQGSSNSQSAIPLAERERVTELATSLEQADLGSFERPPTRARYRYAARYTIALLALAGLLYAGGRLTEYDLFWYLPLVGLVVVPLAAHLKWKHRGWAIDDDHVVTRNGFWVRQTKVVPLHRVQTVFSSETIFQRRRDLGTVTVDTAGAYSFASGDPQAVDIDAATVAELRGRVADGLHDSLRRRARERDSGPTSDAESAAD